MPAAHSKTRVLAIAWLSMAACAHGPVQPAPCVSPIEAQLEQGARAIGNHRPARSGVFDVALPEDEGQYRALNKMTVLAITVFSRSADDLPIRKIGFNHASDPVHYVLPRIFGDEPVRALPEDSLYASKFGRYRQDVFVMIPVRFLREPGSVVVELNKPFTALELGGMPVPFDKKLKFIADDRNGHEDPHGSPDGKLVMAILAGQYCVPISTGP